MSVEELGSGQVHLASYRSHLQAHYHQGEHFNISLLTLPRFCAHWRNTSQVTYMRVQSISLIEGSHYVQNPRCSGFLTATIQLSCSSGPAN